MKTAVQKWGNSLALRIPKAYADETSLREGASVDLTLESGTLVVRPIRMPALTLEGLLEGVNPRNRHPSVETGPVVGREVW